MLTSCQNKKKTKDGLDVVTLTLDWTPKHNHTGFYVAQALGFFKAEGTELSIMQPTRD